MASFSSDLNLKFRPGKINNQNIVLTGQSGAVLKGTVTFCDGRPACNATVVLSYLCNGASIPVTFTFTDKNGEFILGIKNTNLDYIVNVSYY